MTSLTATDFAALHDHLKPFLADKRWIFRGHANAEWQLMPKAGRTPYSDVPDSVVFDTWKRRATEYVTNRVRDDWDWLAIAQHHGLATRLLDWSANPLNAAFFALRENSGKDAQLIAIKPKYSADMAVHPMQVDSVSLFRPRAVVARIVRQGGLFTVHASPQTSIEKCSDDITEIVRITLPNKSRDSLLAQLSFYGVNSATLFPDLDGLSEFLNWSIASGEYFRK